MPFQYPANLRYSAEQFLDLFKNRAIELSRGKLFDFGEASGLRLVAEAEAIPLLAHQTATEEKIAYAIAASLESYLNFPRGTGTQAQVYVRFQLDKIYASPFPIPRGYRFSAGGKVFETRLDLQISGTTDTADPNKYSQCRVPAMALDIGADGNAPAQQCSILQSIPGIQAVFIDESATGGTDEESLEDWYDRLSSVVAAAMQRDVLIKEGEFQEAAAAILGAGSIVVAVPELSANRLNKEIAAMHLFAAQRDGSALTQAQRRSISEQLSPRAPLARGRLYISDLSITDVTIELSVTLTGSAGADGVGTDVNQALRNLISLSTTIGAVSLDYYRAIAAIYAVSGVKTAFMQWRRGTDALQAADLELPRLATGTTVCAPARIATLTVNFGGGITRSYSG